MDERLRNLVKSQSLIDDSTPLIVAVSGGVDSMVLLHVLITLKYNIIIAHVDHGLRAESKTEKSFLINYAKEHDIKIETHTIKHTPKNNFHQYARDIRYRFFTEVAQKHNTNQVALAHHKDDQIETYFMRLIHNHDILTLKGMKPTEKRNDINFVRPLLSVSKTTIKAYAKAHNIHYFEDSSNKDDKYTRNRFRNNFLPFISQENPNYQEAIINHMEDLQDINELVKENVSNLNEKYRNLMPLDTWWQLNELIKKAYLIYHMRKIDSHSFISSDHFNTLQKQLSIDKNFVIPLSKNVVIYKEYDKFRIEKAQNEVAFNIEILEDGVYSYKSDEHYHFSKSKNVYNSSNCFELWYNVEVYPLQLRTRLTGDYITFQYGKKKLKDLFIDLKIPPFKRDHLLLLTKGKEVLWIPDLGIQAHQKPLTNKLVICQCKEPNIN